MPSLPPVQDIIAILLVIFLAIGLHEFSHAKFADMAGDPTPREHGRVTLNLIKHFDPIGTVMIIFTSLLGVGIGWGKPVPMNPGKMKNPRWDYLIAVLAGPGSNFAQATIFAVVLRFMVLGHIPVDSAHFLPKFLIYGVMINISLCCFNLLPIGALDGMWILGTFLPEKQRYKWTIWNLSVGQFAFLGIVLVGQMLPELSLLRTVILPPMQFLFRVLTGYSL